MKSKNRNIRVGDVYSIELLDGRWMYFQFIGKDSSCLDGNVIVAFKHTTAQLKSPAIDLLKSSGIYFIAQCYVRSGLQAGLFVFVVNESLALSPEGLHFRNWISPKGSLDMPEWCEAWEIWEYCSSKHIASSDDPKLLASAPGIVFDPASILYMFNNRGVPEFYPKFV